MCLCGVPVWCACVVCLCGVPVWCACVHTCMQVCEALLRSKAEVNTKDKKYGWTAIMHATHLKYVLDLSPLRVVGVLGQWGTGSTVGEGLIPIMVVAG